MARRREASRYLPGEIQDRRVRKAGMVEEVISEGFTSEQGFNDGMFPAANPVLPPMLSPEGLETDEAQMLLISATRGPTLDEEDLGAQSPTNPKEIFSSARQRAAMPSQFRCAMAAKLLERREGFPLQGVLPVGEAAPRPPVCRQERSRAGRRVW